MKTILIRNKPVFSLWCSLFTPPIHFLSPNKACCVKLSWLKYQVVSSLLFHILPPVSKESVYRAITVKAPQIYVFQPPDRSLPIWNSHLIKRTPFMILNFWATNFSHKLIQFRGPVKQLGGKLAKLRLYGNTMENIMYVLYCAFH